MQLDPDLVPDLINSLCKKGYICSVSLLHHLAKITVSAHLFLIHVQSILASRSNLERCPCSRENLACSPLPCRIA